MGNFHHNGPEPEVMTREEHDRQAELWEANGEYINEIKLMMIMLEDENII